VDSAARR